MIAAPSFDELRCNAQTIAFKAHAALDDGGYSEASAHLAHIDAVTSELKRRGT
jgi:hypothetical protein